MNDTNEMKKMEEEINVLKRAKDPTQRLAVNLVRGTALRAI